MSFLKTVEFKPNDNRNYLGKIIYGNDECEIFLKEEKESIEVEFHINKKLFSFVNLDEMAFDALSTWLEEKQ